jgi:hypothetical protein
MRKGKTSWLLNGELALTRLIHTLCVSVFTHRESLFKVVVLILEEYFMNSRPIIMWQRRSLSLRFSVNTFAPQTLLLEAETHRANILEVGAYA